MRFHEECPRGCGHLFPVDLGGSSPPWFVLGLLYNLTGALIVVDHLLNHCSKRHEETAKNMQILRYTNKLLLPYKPVAVPACLSDLHA